MLQKQPEQFFRGPVGTQHQTIVSQMVDCRNVSSGQNQILKDFRMAALNSTMKRSESGFVLCVKIGTQCNQVLNDGASAIERCVVQKGSAALIRSFQIINEADFLDHLLIRYHISGVWHQLNGAAHCGDDRRKMIRH